MINFFIVPIKKGDRTALSQWETTFTSVESLRNNGDEKHTLKTIHPLLKTFLFYFLVFPTGEKIKTQTTKNK